MIDFDRLFITESPEFYLTWYAQMCDTNRVLEYLASNQDKFYGEYIEGLLYVRKRT